MSPQPMLPLPVEGYRCLRTTPPAQILKNQDALASSLAHVQTAEAVKHLDIRSTRKMLSMNSRKYSATVRALMYRQTKLSYEEAKHPKEHVRQATMPKARWW